MYKIKFKNQAGYREDLTHAWRCVLGCLILLAGQTIQAQTPSNSYSYSRTSSFTYVAAGSAQAGLLASETVEPSNPNLCVTTNYTYDAYGNKSVASTSSCAGVSASANFIARSNTSTYNSALASQPITVSGSAQTVAVVPGMFPTTSANALNQTETKTFDPRFGAMLTLTGPNGLTTSWVLDDFGRKVKELRADGTSTVMYYCVVGAGLDTSSNSASCPNTGSPGTGEVPSDAVSFVHSEPHDVNGNKMGPFARIYSDRLGRQIRNVTESFDGSAQPSSYKDTLIVADTVYSAYGAKAVQTQQYFLNTLSSTTTGNTDVGVSLTVYDALGRPAKIYTTDANGSQSGINFGVYGSSRQAAQVKFTYTGLNTQTTNDHGQTRLEEKNANGEVIRVTDALGAQIAYQRDAFGNLLQTVDALQNTIKLTYDIRGHKVQMVDPDTGTWNYTYDALGELLTQQSANQAVAGTSTTMTYDVLGRMISRVEPEYTSNWSYDHYANSSACPMGIGKLCESSTSAGVDHQVAYDSYGRPQTALTSVSTGPSFATAISYDSVTGRVLSKTYPTGLQVGYSYTSLGFLQQLNLLTAATVNPLTATGSNGGVSTGQSQATLAAGSVLWTAQTADAWGKLEKQTYGNGVITRAVFDATQGRLNSITADAGSGNGVVMSQSYAWDSLSNVTSRTDNNGDTSAGGVSTGAVNETFAYDALNRLAGYQVSAPTVEGLSRSVTLQYNALGMLLYKSDVGNYAYNAQGGAQPHALQSMTGGATTSYGYDANGNLITASAGTYSSLSYTSFNLPDSQNGIKGPAGSPDYVWQYDENHQRVKEIRTNASGTRTIWYQHPDNQGGLGFESEVEVNGSVSNRHFLSVGGQAIGVLVSTGALPATATLSGPTVLSSVMLVKVEYWHKDHLGSLISTTDHTGAVTERYAYDPFGKRRFVNGNYDEFGVVQADWSYTQNWGAGRGFTGHEQLDDVGLVHMNGRIFDPTLGMFLQADPMNQNPGNLQNYNRYAYCYNSPMGCTDPSGYCSFFCGVWHGIWDNKALRMAMSLVAAMYLGPEGLAWGEWGLLGTSVTNPLAQAAIAGFVSGTIASGNFEGGLKGAVTAGAFVEAGDFLNAQGAFSGGTNFGEHGWESVAVHGVVGCVTTMAGGGKCGQGALSASFSQSVTAFGPESINGMDAQSIVAHVVAGGTASVLGGGTFANGAETAAFGYLFNYLGHCTSYQDECMKREGYQPTQYANGAVCNSSAAGCTLGQGTDQQVGQAAVVLMNLAMAPVGLPFEGVGLAGSGFFEGALYTEKVLGQMANPLDVYHAFPSLVDTLAAESGQVTKIIGGDGATYIKLQVDGAYNGVKGVFEYIKDLAGNINHRYFNAGR